MLVQRVAGSDLVIEQTPYLGEHGRAEVAERHQSAQARNGLTPRLTAISLSPLQADTSHGSLTTHSSETEVKPSGPSRLQVSSSWTPEQPICVLAVALALSTLVWHVHGTEARCTPLVSGCDPYISRRLVWRRLWYNSACVLTAMHMVVNRWNHTALLPLASAYADVSLKSPIFVSALGTYMVDSGTLRRPRGLWAKGETNPPTRALQVGSLRYCLVA